MPAKAGIQYYRSMARHDAGVPMKRFSAGSQPTRCSGA
jgi:hypothetical protein